MLRHLSKNTLICLFVSMVVLWLLGSCQHEKVQHLNHEEHHEEHHPGDALHPHPHPHQHTTAGRSREKIMKNFSVISVYTFDPSKGEKGRISYDLLEPARMRIAITEKDDPDQLYRILFWDWQEAGHHVVEWDGTDQSGFPIDRKQCAVRTRCITKSAHRPGTRVIKPLTTEQLVQGLQGSPDHRLCDVEKCKPMKLRFVGILEHDERGGVVRKELLPGIVLSRVVTIEVEAARDARGYGELTGYGVRWMVDQQLVAAQYYERESDGKFHYSLDTTAFRDGERVLRVSSCDHYDHTGLVGTKVVFDNSRTHRRATSLRLR